MSSSSTAIVDAFFDAYRLAFERSDAAAIADHFAKLTSRNGFIPRSWLGAEQR